MSELIALLKRIGLNDYESKAYGALLKLRSAFASDVSKEAGIPRARVYDVLLSLEHKGFVVSSAERPISFKALSPKQALENVEKSKKKEFQEHLNELQQLKEKLLNRTDFIEKDALPEMDNVWLLKGRQNIYSTIENLLSKSANEVIVFSNEKALMQKLQSLGQKFSDLTRKGIKLEFRLKGNVNNLGNELLKELKPHFKVSGSECNSRFMVFDKKNVLLFLACEPHEKEKALLIESPFIAQYLSEIK